MSAGLACSASDLRPQCPNTIIPASLDKSASPWGHIDFNEACSRGAHFDIGVSEDCAQSNTWVDVAGVLMLGLCSLALVCQPSPPFSVHCTALS